MDSYRDEVVARRLEDVQQNIAPGFSPLINFGTYNYADRVQDKTFLRSLHDKKLSFEQKFVDPSNISQQDMQRFNREITTINRSLKDLSRQNKAPGIQIDQARDVGTIYDSLTQLDSLLRPIPINIRTDVTTLYAQHNPKNTHDLIDIKQYKFPYQKHKKETLFAYGTKETKLTERKIKKSIIIGVFKDKIEIVIKAKRVVNDDIRILSHILTQYTGALLKMNTNRKLRKVGQLGDENHNMTLIISTIHPAIQNHYIVKVKHKVGGFLVSPTAHFKTHEKLLFNK